MDVNDVSTIANPDQTMGDKKQKDKIKKVKAQNVEKVEKIKREEEDEKVKTQKVRVKAPGARESEKTKYVHELYELFT